MKEVKFKINSAYDRDNVIIAFANAGMKVKIETERTQHLETSYEYWVIVEVPDENIKG